MTRTAYLHIGLPKTGTTYLQHAIWSNKRQLAADGIVMLGKSHRAHLLGSVDIRESPRLDRRAGRDATPWQDLVDEARRCGGDVLISHEFYCAASPPQIERIVSSLEGFDLRVIITARPMSSLGISRWQEWVKNGGKRPVDKYPARDQYDPADDWGWGSFDLADVLGRWGQVIGPDHITVLILDPGSARPDDLWLRFARVLGIDGSAYQIVAEPKNPSLGVVEVELLRRVNAKLSGFSSAADRGRWIRRYVAEGDILPARHERFHAGREKQAEYAQRDRLAAEMLRAGGYIVDGDLARFEQEAPILGRHPDEVTAAELLDSATTAIANLLRDVRALTDERDALRRAEPGQRVGLRGRRRAAEDWLKKGLRGRS
jgi:hypothetical protein